MCISISVLQTRVNLAFLALITLYYTQLSFAVFLLTLVRPRIFSLIWWILNLFSITSSWINMLIPHLIRWNRLVCSLHRNFILTYGTNNNIVIIYSWIPTFSALMIIWSPMLFTVHVSTKITLKRQKVLLVAILYFTVLPNMSKLHFNQLI